MKIAIVPWDYYVRIDPKLSELILTTIDENRQPVAVTLWNTYASMEHPLALSLLKQLTDAQGDQERITVALHAIQDFNTQRANVREMVSQD